MRIIPIDNNTALIVLQEMPMSELMKADGHKDLICNVSGTEDIVIYRQHENYFNDGFWYIEDVNLEIERSGPRPGNAWRSASRQKAHNEYFIEVKSIMTSYIREKQIDKVLKKEDENEDEYLWC